MGRFDGFLFCVDCDGTLTNRKGEITPKNVEAILEFQKAGGLFTFASGRFPQYIKRFFPYFKPNTYQIMGNGTTIYDVFEERIVEEATIPITPEPVRHISLKDDCIVLYINYREHSRFWLHPGEMPPWGELREYTNNIEDLFIPDEEPWHKVDFIFKSPEKALETRKEMQVLYPMFQFVRGWERGVELLPMEGGKGNALVRLKTMLGDKIHTVIAAGDYENDISMLEVADVGYAVENACPECKEAADKITVSCDEDAIYTILEEWKKKL